VLGLAGLAGGDGFSSDEGAMLNALHAGCQRCLPYPGWAACNNFHCRCFEPDKAVPCHIRLPSTPHNMQAMGGLAHRSGPLRASGFGTTALRSRHGVCRPLRRLQCRVMAVEVGVASGGCLLGAMCQPILIGAI
jgi:hypothetical protein